MIYLIGSEHCAQRKRLGKEPSVCQSAYKWVVQCAIESVHPKLVAEEDHPDLLSKDRRESILKSVAAAHEPKIEHRFVDPNEAERERIGDRTLSRDGSNFISNLAHEIKHHFPKREQFWLGKIEDLVNEGADILFVCGCGHIESFRELLIGRGIGCSVLATGIGATPDSLLIDERVRNYIKNNPKEF